MGEYKEGIKILEELIIIIIKAIKDIEYKKI
jgi:hypothetical protein